MLILGLRADGAHGVTAAAKVGATTPTDQFEVEVVREVVFVVRDERGRPEDAVKTGIVEVTLPVTARSREEKLTSVFSSHKDTTNSILLSKGLGAIILEFL